jgi:hypothetical protein
MAWGFAWVNAAATTFDEPTHNRVDEEIIALQIDHSEGDFAMLSVELKNPRRQLLTDPNIWVWLSRDGAPVFFGRLVAIPEEITAEVVRINFVARPAGYQAAKIALANSLRVAPWYDPVWIAEGRETDPDVVLEARPEIWHIDRLTHALTVTNIITGEDGTTILGAGDFIYESLDMRYGSPPVRKVAVEAEVSWDQIAEGTLDLSNQLTVETYTGEGLGSDWPKAGQRLGGKWEVIESSLRRTDGTAVPTAYGDVNVGSLSSGAGSESVYAPPVTARFYKWAFASTFIVGYSVSRDRKEKISFEVFGNVQNVFSEPGDEAELLISLASRNISSPIDAGGATPILNNARSSYLQTDRGTRSINYLMCLARAKLLARARAIEITVAVPIATALALRGRENVTINDGRLPTGTGTGKVTSYRIVAGGDGQQYGEITIACTIGTGGSITPSLGTATHHDDYSDEYQVMTGSLITAAGGDLTFEDISEAAISDDGVDFIGGGSGEAPSASITITNDAAAQAAILAGSYSDINAAIETLNANFTEITLNLTPVEGGPFESTFTPAVSGMIVPQTIVL